MYWYKKSLFAKLLTGMLIVAVIPYSLSNVISYKTTSNSMESQVIQLNQDVMETNIENVKRYIRELNRISVTFYQDQTLMKYLRSSESAPLKALYIKGQLDALYNMKAEFRAVRYTSSVDGFSMSKTDNNVSGEELRNSTMLPPKTDDRQWGAEKSYEVARLGKTNVLALHKPIVDYPKDDVLGLLSLYVGLDEIGRLIQPQSGLSAGDAVFLLIRNRQLYPSDDEPFASPDTPLAFEGEKGSLNGQWHGMKGVFIYVKDDYMDLPLTAVKFVSRAAINDSATKTLNSSLVIQFAAIGFVILFAFIFSFAVIAPIKRLLRSIARVETGNFDIDLTSGRKDELGVLELRFQSMVRNIDDLMNREYRNRLELTTARLKMLLAQINPHFLYNTLQSISTLALRQGAAEVNDRISELGAILRYSMDLKTEIVPLKIEVEQIERYLSLQMGRFKNKLSYTLSCPQEALSISVPKLILQPLVENSIIHGFEKGTGSGTIHIAIELTDRRLSIRILDNGKGMEPEQIEQLKRGYADFQLQSGQEGGIGLINVLHRLRLYYGSEFSWDMTSAPYEETVVVLRMTVDSNAKEARAG